MRSGSVTCQTDIRIYPGCQSGSHAVSNRVAVPLEFDAMTCSKQHSYFSCPVAVQSHVRLCKLGDMLPAQESSASHAFTARYESCREKGSALTRAAPTLWPLHVSNKEG